MKKTKKKRERGRRSIEMRKVDLSYIAGLFDGEGCISIAKCSPRRIGNSPYYRLEVAVVMANEYIPKLFQFHFGGRTYKKKGMEYWRQQWQWHAGSEEAVDFLKAILPYLRLKRDEAKLALEFQSNKRVMAFERKPAGALAIEEAQRLLMKGLKDKTA